jgi:PmbA protein
MSRDLNDLLQALIGQAEQKGASCADAVAVDHLNGHVRVRMGEIEQIQRAREHQVGLRVFFGNRQAISATGDLRTDTLNRLVEDTCAMAQVTADVPLAGLPVPADCGAGHVSCPDIFDETADTFDLERGVDWAKRGEAAALDFDPIITNSEGAEFGFASVRRHYAASGGVSGSYQSSYFSGYIVPVATRDGVMERDYWHSQRRKLAELESPEEIGRIAAARTVRRMGAVQEKTCQVPVVFDERTASQLLGHFSRGLSGYALYKGASYLRDRMETRVASDLVQIVDDGTVTAGMGSRPYDGEGIGTTPTSIVENGVLKSYLLDTYSGRKMEMASTGNASRSVGDAPGVAATNLHLNTGDTAPEDLLSGIKNGFYVTELIGFGVNLTTGDYSQGASGMWIVDGALSHAVSEVTIAGHLLEMFQNIEAIGSEMDVYRRISSPALRLSKMTIAGA